MLSQHDPLMDKEIYSYGCAAMSLIVPRLHSLGRDVDPAAMKVYWNRLIDAGVITGDLNGDGIRGDTPEELVISSWDLACKEMSELGLSFVIKTDSVEAIPALLSLYAHDSGYYGVTPWYNPSTGYRHYVEGFWKEVDYDPIQEGSVTVAHGYPVGLRVFRKVV